jgi:opacity protein-like surface antigen
MTSSCVNAAALVRRIAVCALLAGACAPASAADLLDDSWLRGSLTGGPVRWDGVVMGGQIAYSSMQSNFGNSSSTQIAFILRDSTLENEAAPQNWTTLSNKLTNARSFGAFLGYNMQWDELVLGGDIGYNRMSKAETTSTDSLSRIVTTSDHVVHNVNIQASSSIRLIDYATFRGRAGYAFGQFLPYAIFGGAVGRFNYTNTTTVNDLQQPPAPAAAIPFTGTQTDGQNNKFGYGFLWGLGMDVAITPNIFLRGEWEYISFNKIGGTLNTLNTGRVGIGLRF